MDDRKTKIYGVISNVWQIMKTTGFDALSDSDWEKLILDFGKPFDQLIGERKSPEEKFAENVYFAMIDYYERISKVNKK